MSKVVFITGISSGFGRQTAELLARKGYVVYGASRNDFQPAQGIFPIKANVTDKEAVKKAIETVLQKEGRIDVLINNAGMGIAGSVEEASEDEMKLQVNTNFYGAVHTIQAVLPGMRKQGSGTIINISSVGGLMGLPYQGFYSASKFALEGLSESLYMELKPHGINVILINPGDFSTSFTAKRIIIKKSNEESAYQPQFLKTLSVIEKDEGSGLNPEILARKLLRIIEKKNPCMRYVVASFEQKLAVALMHILPAKWFFKIISSHYGVK